VWVAHDPADAEVAFHHAERLRASWPGAQLHAVSGLGHRRILRDPRVTSEAVAFLREGSPELRSEEAQVSWELFHRDARAEIVA